MTSPGMRSEAWTTNIFPDENDRGFDQKLMLGIGRKARLIR
jgi:hypothetical protein